MTPTLQKLIANGLWHELRHNRWRGPRSTRDLNDYGDTKPYRAVAKGAVPKSPKLNANITQAEPRGIACIITPDSRNGLESVHYAHLTIGAYHRTLAPHSTAAQEAWHEALAYSEGPPYDWHAYRGEQNLIRRWDPWINGHCYRILHDLVKAATHGTITSDDAIPASSSTENAVHDAPEPAVYIP